MHKKRSRSSIFRSKNFRDAELNRTLFEICPLFCQDGWEYAVNFGMEYFPENDMTTCVRRRKFCRIARKQSNPDSAVRANSLQVLEFLTGISRVFWLLAAGSFVRGKRMFAPPGGGVITQICKKTIFGS